MKERYDMMEGEDILTPAGLEKNGFGKYYPLVPQSHYSANLVSILLILSILFAELSPF